MSDKGQISITLPGKQIQVVSISLNEYTFRHIQKQLEYIQPDEFTVLYDEGQRKIVSKYMDRLQPNNRYQLICSKQLFEQWKVLTSKIEKYEEMKERDRRRLLDLETQITQQKQKIESQDKMLEQMNSQGNLQQEFLNKSKTKIKLFLFQRMKIKI